MSGIADFFNEYFKPLGDLSHLVDDENSYTSRLVEHDEATGGGTGFSGPKQHAIANNERRVKKMTNRNRMSPTYTQQQGIDPEWVDFIQKDEENWKKWLQDNLPRRQVDASMVNDPMLAEAPGTRALYDAIAEETPAQRAAINAPASLPKTNVSPLDLDYTGAMGIPEYTPEHVNQAVSDVESGRYSPERIIRDAAWTGVSIPATALQMGLNTVNPLVGGALDDFINQYNKGLDATKQYIASPQLIESGNEIAQQIQNQDFAGTLGAIAENPGWVLSEALRNMGTMAVPTGIAGVLGKVAQAAKATQLARFAPSAEKAAQIGSQIGNVAMNLGSTFSDSDLQDLPLAQRYLAGAISGAGTAAIGALTDGGAEGLIAKRLFNQDAAPAAERGILPLLKNAIKEGVQEYGEGMSDYTGQQVAKGQPVDLKAGTIQNLPDVVMGALTGGATHIGTNLGRRAQPLQTQQTTPQTDEALIQSVLDAVTQQPPRQPQVQAAPVETTPLETPNEQSVQAEPIQQAQEQEQQTASINIGQNPSFDLIKANGGLSQQALSDLGFEAQDAKSLPQGLVADKNGLSVQDAQALLRKADMDDDIETLMDYAVRQTTGTQQTTDDTADWKAWVDKQIQESEEPTRSLQRPIHQEALTRNDTQNRDRSSKQSIIQMNSIASNPDYGRLGVTNDFGNGSPVVYGDNAHVLKGKSGTMIASDGRRIPFTYGVVDAKYLIPSNLADGTPVAEYDTGAVGKLRAIAGNGRTAGIKEAYSRGTAGNYRQELMEDADSHGVSADRIAGMKNPVLVRVVDQNNINRDTADLSNQSSSMALSRTEQAEQPSGEKNSYGVPVERVTTFKTVTKKALNEALEDIKPNDSLNGRDYESTRNAVSLMRKGEIAVDDLKRVALEALDNEESIKAGLNKLTIAELRPMVSFYTRGKKADYVNAAYDQLLFDLLPFESFSTVYGGGQTFKQQYTDKVNSLTQNDIKEYSGNIKKKRQARKKALTNPETLDEFRTFLRINDYDALTSKQKAVYDDLLATKKREDAKQEKAKPEPRQKKTAPVSEVKAEIVETKHTKTGEPLYVVKLSGRVESDDFKSMRKTAGENSGYYSRYSKGFQFKDRADAESFLNTINGNTTETEVQEAPEETAEQPVNKKTVKRMRDIAQANIDRAELKLNADRKTNTSRRARKAAGIEEDARKELRAAKTMMNIADAVESGEARHLADIKDMTQVVQLDSLLLMARDNELLAKYPEYVERMRHDHEKVTEDTVNYAKYPEGDRKADSRKRLERAGIMDVVMLRAALREYAALRSDRVERDKIKDAERAIVGKEVGEDFFPTPPSVASRMAEMAGISEGDRVLEPSAGSGNLADAAKQAGGKVDAIEIDDRLRNILDAKGHEVVAEDFMSYDPSEKYDVVIMNPPFSKRRDAEHIMRAYDMLKDGGRLVAIAGEGVFFGQDKKAEAFRTWLDNHGAYIEKLPENTFSDKKLLRTTGVNARLIKITKREDAQYATRSMPVHQSYSTVKQVTEALKADKANDAAIVVQSVSDLPGHLREQAEERDPSTIEGVYDPEENKPYLIADNISDPERAIEVARHEVIGHYGIEAMLGKDAMDQTVQRVLDGIANNNKLLNELVKDVDTRQPGLDKTTRAKEVIAMMAERNLQNGIARRILNAIRKFLHKLGLIKSDVTDADIAKMLRDARQYVLEHDGEMIGTGKAQYSKGKLHLEIPDNPQDGIRKALDSTGIHAIARVSEEAVKEAKAHGLEIANYIHAIDKSAINHIIKRHGNQRSESLHGQMGVTEKDFLSIPEVITHPDKVIYGLKNGIGRDMIAYVKKMSDGTTLYLEEVRNSREILAAQSMRKFSPAVSATSVVKSLYPTSETLRGTNDTISIVETPEARNTTPLFSQNQGVFDVPEVTRADNIIRAMQDRMIDIKRIQKAIEETGGVIRERENVYGKEELYTARVDARIKKFDEQWVTPLLKDIKETGMSIAEVGDWLYARHVVLDKVNQRLAEINPDHPEKHKLSGLTDQEAHKIYQEGIQNEILQRVGKRIDTLTRRNVQQRVLNGLMTQEEAKQWLTYNHYVPMNRDNSGAGISPKGRGMEVKSKESKRRMGSTTRASDILANLFANSIDLIQRIEKARVGRSLLDLARNHPNEAFWKVDIPKTVKRLNPQTGLVERVRRDENLMPANNVLVVKENGIEHWIAFNKNNERAMRIAQAMKQLDGDQAKFFTNTIGRITRYMGQWMTSKNPAFMFSNFFRDVQDAVFNLSSTPISGKEAELIRHIPSAMKAIWQMERGTGNQENEMLRFAKEFREAGGETAFLGFRGTIKEQSEALEKRLRELTDGKPAVKQILGAVGGVIANANDAVENSVRLATYVTARNGGLSRDKAASIAKNITVNFNRRGSSTSIINSLYLFANANIQGHTRMLQAMVTSRKAQIVGAALIGASFALSMLGRAAMGDTWDDIPDWEKENNWILPLGTSGDYIKIPIGPGLKLFHFAGNLLEQSIFGKDKVSIIELASHIALSTIDNFNVFGSSGSLGQLVSPTVLRPAIQILENKKFTGAKMYQDAVSPFTGYAAPAYTKAFGSTPRHWVAISKFLNWASGGDNIKPGSLNVPAEAIAHAMKSYLMPGTVNEIDRALTAVENIVGKGTFGPQSVPLLNRVYGHTDEGQNYARLVKQMQDWNQKVEEVRSYNKEASGEGSTMSKKGREHLSVLNENKGVAFNMFKNFRKFKKLVIDTIDILPSLKQGDSY